MSSKDVMGTGVDAEVYPAFDSFEQYGLDPKLLHGIYASGVGKPSAIQQRGIQPILDGRDTIGQAESGTGRTATFVIGVLQRIDVRMQACQALILAPTRELAIQIQKVVQAFGDFMQVRCHACIGGTSVRLDNDILRDGQHVVVGTPGRVFDMIRKRRLVVDHLLTFVVDEADEMLSRVFNDQISNIYSTLPPKVQVCFFAASMSPEILDLTMKFTCDAVQIVVKEKRTLDGVQQFYVSIEETWKLDTLRTLSEWLMLTQAIIYCNTRRKVDFLATQLRQLGLTISAVHAGLEAKDRDSAMSEFRAGSSQVLISTDLARGMGVQQVSLVINYDLPAVMEKYLHRIGHSGRFGRKGFAISFVTKSDLRLIKEIERFYQTEIEQMPANIAVPF